jgi:hypothetical protein
LIREFRSHGAGPLGAAYKPAVSPGTPPWSVAIDATSVTSVPTESVNDPSSGLPTASSSTDELAGTGLALWLGLLAWGLCC